MYVQVRSQAMLVKLDLAVGYECWQEIEYLIWWRLSGIIVNSRLENVVVNSFNALMRP